MRLRFAEESAAIPRNTPAQSIRIHTLRVRGSHKFPRQPRRAPRAQRSNTISRHLQKSPDKAGFVRVKPADSPVDADDRGLCAHPRTKNGANHARLCSQRHSERMELEKNLPSMIILYFCNWCSPHSPRELVSTRKHQKLTATVHTTNFIRLICLATILLLFAGCSRRKPVAGPDGGQLFAEKCAACHRPNSGSKAPLPDELRQMSSTSILAALESGKMRWEGKWLTKAQRNAVADYLGSSSLSASIKMSGFCARDLDPPANPPIWNGWGVDAHNTRYQPARAAGLTADQVSKLTLKWAFGFPGASATYGQPTSVAGRVFVGSEDGTVYALDAATGCLWWMSKAAATVKTAVSIGNHGHTAYFGDTNGNVYAVAVSDGSLIWKVHPESHIAARITGSPLLLGSRLYVPISSGEEGAAADPKYPCCSFRGSVVALDAASGNQVWKT
jgi:hypothetical protein